MENQIYRIEMSDEHYLELSIVDTNELNPYKHIKEIGIFITKENVQIDGDLDVSALDSLIKYLTDCKEYIKEFNSASKPETEDTQPV